MRKYILPVLGIFLVALSTFSFALKPINLVFAQGATTAADEPEPIDNKGIWGKIKEGVQSITGAVGESISQLVSKFFTSIADFLLSTVCPQCTVGGRDMAANPNLPDGMRLGLVGTVENGVTAMFESQPRIDVVAHLSEEWVPGYKEKQSVYASGYDDLMETNIDTLWSVTRNIAYVGFVVVMIIVGFMIMFRNKVGGQTVVTVGNAIPKVVVGLVLVTFSFAIAGLILDISGILMRVIAGVLSSDIPIHNIFKLLGGILGLGGGITVGALGIAGIVLIITQALGPAGIILLVLALIILGIVLFGAIKLWFSLVKTYFSLLINVIISPLAIMAGSIPGNEAMTVNVFKSMLRNALVFPLAFAIVNLPYFLVEKTNRIRFTFPETVFEDATAGDTIGPIMLALAKIVAIFVAAQAPEFAKALIPATASKGGADAAGAIKQGLSKVPLVGGMFK
ncbi:MAG: hypothetical protein WCY37_00215 [Candidatus Dojkabacteria bacterium]